MNLVAPEWTAISFRCSSGRNNKTMWQMYYQQCGIPWRCWAISDTASRSMMLRIRITKRFQIYSLCVLSWMAASKFFRITAVTNEVVMITLSVSVFGKQIIGRSIDREGRNDMIAAGHVYGSQFDCREPGCRSQSHLAPFSTRQSTSVPNTSIIGFIRQL